MKNLMLLAVGIVLALNTFGSLPTMSCLFYKQSTMKRLTCATDGFLLVNGS